ncbi:hypothetical protein DVJ78_02660 [Humibacter sp. BT305]|nr:hypothetical protein DVJ78_02660 [Humibacter sp. BT305]
MIDSWIQSLPGIETRLQTAIREAREVIADLDDTPPPAMDHMFYMQAYDVLHLQLGELLEAIDDASATRSPRDEPDGGRSG